MKNYGIRESKSRHKNFHLHFHSKRKKRPLLLRLTRELKEKGLRASDDPSSFFISGHSFFLLVHSASYHLDRYPCFPLMGTLIFLFMKALQRGLQGIIPLNQPIYDRDRKGGTSRPRLRRVHPLLFCNWRKDFLIPRAAALPQPQQPLWELNLDQGRAYSLPRFPL